MKNRLFLLGIPALIALSCCIGFSSSPISKNLMAEDTLAHEEIFGAVQEGGYLGIKSPRKLDTLTSDFVKIGYQIKFAENEAGDADDTISIRFVAAIKNAGVTAFWHRGFAQADGTIGVDRSGWKYKFEDAWDLESSKMYLSLSGGGETITAGPKGTSGYTDYAGFAIYTLRNIPYETYKDSYLAAYVTLTDTSNGENYINSQALAVKVERDGTSSKNNFTFDPGVTGHFLQGTIGGNANTLLRATEDTGYNYAHYSNVALEADDYFGSFYYDPSHFQFCGYDSYFVNGSSLYMDASDVLGGYASPKANGTYSLYVYSSTSGSENQVFTISSAAGANQNYRVYDFPSFVNSDGCVVFASVHLAGGDTWEWRSVTLSGNTGTFVAPKNCSEFLLVRCVSGTTQPNWGFHDPSNSAGRIYNQTPNISITANEYSIKADSWNEYH